MRILYFCFTFKIKLVEKEKQHASVQMKHLIDEAKKWSENEYSSKKKSSQLSEEYSTKKKSPELPKECLSKKKSPERLEECSSKKITSQLSEECSLKKKSPELPEEYSPQKKSTELPEECSSKKKSQKLPEEYSLKKKSPEFSEECSSKKKSQESSEEVKRLLTKITKITADTKISSIKEQTYRSLDALVYAYKNSGQKGDINKKIDDLKELQRKMGVKQTSTAKTSASTQEKKATEATSEQNQNQDPQPTPIKRVVQPQQAVYQRTSTYTEVRMHPSCDISKQKTYSGSSLESFSQQSSSISHSHSVSSATKPNPQKIYIKERLKCVPPPPPLSPKTSPQVPVAPCPLSGCNETNALLMRLEKRLQSSKDKENSSSHTLSAFKQVEPTCKPSNVGVRRRIAQSDPKINNIHAQNISKIKSILKKDFVPQQRAPSPPKSPVSVSSQHKKSYEINKSNSTTQVRWSNAPPSKPSVGVAQPNKSSFGLIDKLLSDITEMKNEASTASLFVSHSQKMPCGRRVSMNQ